MPKYFAQINASESEKRNLIIDVTGRKPSIFAKHFGIL